MNKNKLLVRTKTKHVSFNASYKLCILCVARKGLVSQGSDCKRILCAVGVLGWLNALASTLDLDRVELGLGGDGHGGGDVDAEG